MPKIFHEIHHSNLWKRLFHTETGRLYFRVSLFTTIFGFLESHIFLVTCHLWVACAYSFSNNSASSVGGELAVIIGRNCFRVCLEVSMRNEIFLLPSETGLHKWNSSRNYLRTCDRKLWTMLLDFLLPMTLQSETGMRAAKGCSVFLRPLLRLSNSCEL